MIHGAKKESIHRNPCQGNATREYISFHEGDLGLIVPKIVKRLGIDSGIPVLILRESARRPYKVSDYRIIYFDKSEIVALEGFRTNHVVESYGFNFVSCYQKWPKPERIFALASFLKSGINTIKDSSIVKVEGEDRKVSDEALQFANNICDLQCKKHHNK